MLMLCRVIDRIPTMWLGDVIQEIQGDLFETKADAMVHCVSADFEMSRGIALEFRTRFGCVEELRAEKAGVGDVVSLRDDENKRWIYYMVTKQRYWHKPTYEAFEQSLHRLHTLCVQDGIRTLAMPRIGCGLDKLKWEQVSAMIRKTFKISDHIQVLVYTKDPWTNIVSV